MTDRLRANGHLVDDLGSAARHGGSALTDAPVLLRKLLEEEAWREFVTQRGDHVRYARFSEFVTTPPLKGLGTEMALIERMVGTSDPDLLVLLRDAEKVGSGNEGGDSPPLGGDGSNASYLAQRLRDQHPEQYAAVKSGELTIHAAAVLAGIRPKRVSVRLDSPESVAQTLRKHLTTDQVTELVALLTEKSRE